MSPGLRETSLSQKKKIKIKEQIKENKVPRLQQGSPSLLTRRPHLDKVPPPLHPHSLGYQC